MRNDKEDKGKTVEGKVDERENGSSSKNRQYLPMKVIFALEIN